MNPRLAALALAAALAACAADDGADAAGAEDRGGCVIDADCADTDVCFDGRCIFQGAPGAEPPPEDPGAPEVEIPLAPYSHPAAGRRHVWVTSPATDTVARIDAETLAIGLVELGDDPIAIEAVPDTDTVIVLARGSDELYRVTHRDGADRVDLWKLTHHHNALALSPDGRHALAWFDLARAEPGEDASALQHVSVLDLTTGDLTGAAVGYRPRRIQFAAGRALVVTEDGVSLLDLAALDGGPAPLVPVQTGLTGGPDREIALTTDGEWAISRDPTEPGVTITRLAEGIPRFIPLGAAPTDLDLLPGDREALVMLRSAARLAIVPFADPAATRLIDVPGARLGAAAVGEDGRRALLYTTTDPAEEGTLAALLDPASGAIVYLPLRKAARGAAVDPRGRVAVVLHEAAPDADDPIARAAGYSLVDLDTAYAKLETTPAPPAGLVFHDDLALLALAADGVSALQRIDLRAFNVRTRTLPSPPEIIGLLPAIDRAFVTQTHPTGRISFLDLDAQGALATVTGFALNGRIE
ncbi:MAG: hypothetical protein R3F65_20125 [bacterium]